MPRLSRGWATLGIVALIPLLGYLTFQFFHPTYTYRYRLTLEVETPDGSVRSGSSVVQVAKWRTPSFMIPPDNLQTTVTGEATPVDLGDGRILVALLTWEVGANRFTGPIRLQEIMGVPYASWRAGTNQGLRQLTRIRAARELRPHQLPMLVTFDDPARPETVQTAAPGNLEASFGPGFRLRRASIELTDAPVTWGVIDRVLPALAERRSGYVDGRRIRTTNELGNTLTYLDFRRGKR